MQRRIFRAAFAAAAVILLVFLGRSPRAGAFRNLTFDGFAWAFSGFSRAAWWVRREFGGDPAERIRSLEMERVSLLVEIAARENLREENLLLREALALRREGEAGVLPAAVIGFLREGRDEFLILNRGGGDGVGVGDVVIDRNRVLGGTVIAVTPKTSRVILLSSSSRSVEVSVPGKGLRAIARGANNRELVIELVPQDAALAPGDLLIASPRATAGRGALFVGEVREVKSGEDVFKSVRAVHRFDPSLDGVLVLLGQ